MQTPDDSLLPPSVDPPPAPVGDERPRASDPKWYRRWLIAVVSRASAITITAGLLLVLYTGSYFALAFATGAGWMELETRHRMVWTVYAPISACAIREPLNGPRIINDVNGWCFSLGWNWFHE